MAAPRGIRRVAQVRPVKTGEATADRATEEVASRVNALARGVLAQAVPVEVELEWGLNKLGHGLKVPVRHFLQSVSSDPEAVVTSRQAENPVPDRTIWIQLDGVASTSVLLFLLPQVA